MFLNDHRTTISVRKRSWFLVACAARLAEAYPDPRIGHFFELLGRHADGGPADDRYHAALASLRGLILELEDRDDSELVRNTSGALRHLTAGDIGNAAAAVAVALADLEETRHILDFKDSVSWEEVWHQERRDLVARLKDIFSPLRPVQGGRSWISQDAIAVSFGIYEDNAFDRLPILADALTDAGCEDEAILSHCRGPGPHVRGCWVVDLVLGKE